MKNGDIKNFRLSNQCSAGNGMLLQAMADQFGVDGHRVRRHRVRGRARAEVQLRLRRVPRLRPRELPEGGLLEGGAARRPRAGAAEERLAVRRPDPAPGGARARSSCSRAARSTTSRPSRRRSTTSRSASRAPRSSSTRTPARPARSAPRSRPCASSSARGNSTLHRHRRGHRPRVHDDERRDDALPLLPERVRAHVHRHQDARRPTRAATSRGFSCEKGTVESEGGDARRSSPSARRLLKQFPNLVDYEAKLRVPALLRRRRRCRTRRHADQGRRGQEGPASASSASRDHAAVPALERRGRGAARAACASASRACSTSTRRRRSSAPTSRRSASRSRTSSSRDETTEEMWVEGGKYGSIDPCFPSKVAQAHIHNLLFHHHKRRRSRSTYIFFPILTHVPTFVEERDGQRVAARSSPARPT